MCRQSVYEIKFLGERFKFDYVRRNRYAICVASLFCTRIQFESHENIRSFFQVDEWIENVIMR